MTFYSEYHFIKANYTENNRISALNKVITKIEKEGMYILSITSRDNDDSITYGITYTND